MFMGFMKNIVLLFVCSLLFVACNEPTGYVITGTVDRDDLNGKYVYLHNIGVEYPVLLNLAYVEKGVFTLKGRQDEAVLVLLRFDEEDVPQQDTNTGEDFAYSVTFILENGKLNAKLEESSFVTGTPENNAWTALRNEMKMLRADLEPLKKEMESDDPEIAMRAGEKYDAIDNQVTDAVSAYIRNNPDKLSVAKLLRDFRYYLSDETKGEALSQAGEKFKAIPYIDLMLEHQEILNKVAIGKKITDFEMADVNGNMHKLSEYAGNGKITLIDFWASWCPPCRRDIPHLVEVYKQFKDKGFEIVGISLDNNKEAWVQGITDLNITWPQLSDLKFWQNEGAALYGVNSIPHTILVDKDGTILAKNLRGNALDAKLAEILK
jgi:peroxiredoxin